MAGATGTWTEEKYEVITKDTELHVGDIVDFIFTMTSLFSWDLWVAVQLAAIEARFEKDNRFTLLRHSYPENNVVTFRVRVDKNPVAASTIVALIVVGAIGFVAWLNLKEIRRIVAGVVEAGGAAAATTLSLGFLAVIALAGFIGFQWLRRRK